MNTEITKYMVYFLSTVTIALLFFSPFGPVDEKLILYHPIGWAGILTYFAMILSFNRRFEATQDNFWLIVAVGFFPLLISDLYFFPIPTLFGFGMLEWAGLQALVFPIGFAYYSQKGMFKYGNLAILMFFPLMAVAFLSGDDTVLSPFKTLFLLVLVVTALSLSYYAYSEGNYLFIIGTILNFMIADVIVVVYVITGTIAFGWEHLFMAVVTDRIAIFGRILMALSGVLGLHRLHDVASLQRLRQQRPKRAFVKKRDLPVITRRKFGNRYLLRCDGLAAFSELLTKIVARFSFTSICFCRLRTSCRWIESFSYKPCC